MTEFAVVSVLYLETFWSDFQQLSYFISCMKTEDAKHTENHLVKSFNPL